MRYAKIFDSLWEGSMRGKSDALLVFINLLTHSEKNGVVDRHWTAIADETGLSVQRTMDALEYLESPDEESRSDIDGGRRIARLDDHRKWGWRIVNHLKYKELNYKYNNAERQQRFRNSNASVTRSNTHVTNTLDVDVISNTGICIEKEGMQGEETEVLPSGSELPNDDQQVAVVEKHEAELEMSRELLRRISEAKNRKLISKPESKSILLLIKAGITQEEIAQAIDWLCKRYRESVPYTPEVQSPRALYENWDKIKSAMEREKNGIGSTGAGVKESWISSATIKQNIQPRRLM